MMRRILILFILYVSLAISTYSQVEKTITELPDYLTPNQGVVHTIKIEVTNNHDKCKQIYLRNDKDITGVDFSTSDLSNPVSILAEWGGTLCIDLTSWLPTPFGVWFKNLEPGSTFTFYFQSTENIDARHLLELIRIRNNDFSFKSQAMKALGWDADEIIIYLPLQ